jgi:hypothetical protein
VTDSGPGIAPEDYAAAFGEVEHFDRRELQGGGSASRLPLSLSRSLPLTTVSHFIVSLSP